MAEDYYELLGVSRDASESEIKEAYRERIKESHPDVSDDREASERTKELIEAKDVLTDEQRRREYDSVDHEQFVAETPESQATDHTDAGESSRSERRANARRARRQRATAEESQRSGRSQQSRRRQQSRQTHQTWSSDSPYVVDRSPGVFDLEYLFDSQQALVLLGTTFIIYPILIAGALFPPFPTAAKLVVGFCTVMVVAYLQSIPQVGIMVFGAWSVLLPLLMVPITGIRLLSLVGVIAYTAVLFPFGLSVLTWIAIKPSRQL